MGYNGMVCVYLYGVIENRSYTGMNFNFVCLFLNYLTIVAAKAHTLGL